ncbi:DUF6417 family protein [Streptomyces mirabilis]|uniref:DUF6417 family protein n=1 Tax=Streptomyces mirabilis TaxID=68239 RepID=UPI00339EA01E
MAEQVRSASCDHGIKRWRLHLTPERITSVAYGLWLHRMTGSAAEATASLNVGGAHGGRLGFRRPGKPRTAIAEGRRGSP